MTTALVRSHASDSDHWYDLSDLVNNTAGGRHGCHCDRRSARATDEHRRATVRRCDVGDDDDGHILWSGALTWSDLALQWEFFGVCVCMSGSANAYLTVSDRIAIGNVWYFALLLKKRSSSDDRRQLGFKCCYSET